MKNTYLYIFCLSLLCLSSCSLETEPIVQQTDTNFYKTTADANSALVACYDGLQVATGASGGVGVPVMSEVMSDDCFGGTGASDIYNYALIDEFDPARSPSDVDLLNNNWKAYYKAIYRCNVFLMKMDQIDWKGDTALRNTYESETKFIRAYIYFEMVRIWGNIPLLTVPSSENIPQSDPEAVYKVIAEDLVFASNNLPATAYSTTVNGHATRWAAKSLLGRVYLYYTGYYGKNDLVGVVTKAQALGHLEDVITSSGHGLVDNFAALWPAASVDNYAGENNKENVFSIKYTYTSDYNGNTDGNAWMVMFGMREFSSYPYAHGWGVTVNSKLWNAYNANDTRRVATVIGVDEENIDFDKINSQREYTGYYNKKYSPMINEDGVELPIAMGSTFWDISQFQDYTVMRYADVLLMAAEANLLANNTGVAQGYFDQVRTRVSLPTKTITMDGIKTERRLELAFEGSRFLDLVRWGDAAAVLKNEGFAKNGNFIGKHTLFPIPDTEVKNNKLMVQNPGW